mgnify:CR=1 FL=1|tara:strand:+ start:30 stop:254 length:225 start_codon:yes stop_codon:yes gene_type:complete
MNDSYAKECVVTCTDNGRTLDVDIGDFRPESYMTVYMNTVKVNLQWEPKHKIYVGGMGGLEFTTKGPKIVGSYR